MNSIQNQISSLPDNIIVNIQHTNNGYNITNNFSNQLVYISNEDARDLVMISAEFPITQNVSLMSYFQFGNEDFTTLEFEINDPLNQDVLSTKRGSIIFTDIYNTSATFWNDRIYFNSHA